MADPHQVQLSLNRISTLVGTLNARSTTNQPIKKQPMPLGGWDCSEFSSGVVLGYPKAQSFYYTVLKLYYV